ncbi:hypothetical protein C8A00DRAFT_30405 [Chaetomidium leptoderma]|uniref:Uncharacterized protein n=1 Tax=Chaetomidium leptoderma TaxID=669021 RepID=A0AAN6VSX7_9PEZI|nr:hypothetical protein C8A00DRAFT_30405 [Chaetomidium leptoderma]
MPRDGFTTLHEARHQRRPSMSGATGYGAQQTGTQQHYTQQPGGPQYYATPVTTSASAPQPWQQPQQQYPGAQPNFKLSDNVKYSDLRKERPQTAEEVLEALSEYFVIRFTRAEEGKKRNPTWEQAFYNRDLTISNKDASDMVHYLDRGGTPVVIKKESLSEDEKCQIELALGDLRKEHDNADYQTTLVQLDDRIRWKPEEKSSVEKERGRGAGREREKEKDRRKSRHRKEYRAPRKYRSKHESEDSKNLTSDRYSLTAYFKRAPRPGADLDILSRDFQQATQTRGFQPQAYVQPTAWPEDRHYPRALEARGTSPGYYTQAYHGGSGRVAIVQPASRRRTGRRSPSRRPPPRGLSPRIHHRGRTPPSPDDSVYSEPSSVFSNGDTDCFSPLTDTSRDSRRDSFDRPRQKAEYREGPAHYGIQPNFNSGSRHPQGPVHIQPHRSNERRPSLQGRRHSVSNPNHGAFIPPSPPAPMQMPMQMPVGAGKPEQEREQQGQEPRQRQQQQAQRQAQKPQPQPQPQSQPRQTPPRGGTP